MLSNSAELDLDKSKELKSFTTVLFRSWSRLLPAPMAQLSDQIHTNLRAPLQPWVASQFASFSSCLFFHTYHMGMLPHQKIFTNQFSLRKVSVDTNYRREGMNWIFMSFQIFQTLTLPLTPCINKMMALRVGSLRLWGWSPGQCIGTWKRRNKRGMNPLKARR